MSEKQKEVNLFSKIKAIVFDDWSTNLPSMTWLSSSRTNVQDLSCCSPTYIYRMVLCVCMSGDVTYLDFLFTANVWTDRPYRTTRYSSWICRMPPPLSLSLSSQAAMQHMYLWKCGHSVASSSSVWGCLCMHNFTLRALLEGSPSLLPRPFKYQMLDHSSSSSSSSSPMRSRGNHTFPEIDVS